MSATVIATKDFSLTLDLGPNGEHILHMPHLSRWSPSIYKQLLTIAAEIHQWALENKVKVFYTGAPITEPRSLKFQTMLGFEPCGVAMKDGEQIQWMKYNV